MKAALFALSAILSVSAAPNGNKGSTCGSGGNGSGNQGKVVGAVYFQSNDPKDNHIVTHSVHEDGTLSFARATSMGGQGSAGGLPGPDPLASQGSVIVDKENLFAVNAGSKSVVMYTIDKSDPTKLTMVGKPVNSGGDFPVSVAVSPNTGDVCVANSGMKNSVNCFSVSQTKGLTALPKAIMPLGLNTTGQSNPPTPFNTLGHIVFTPDGNQVLVAVRGGRTLTGGGILSMDYKCDGSLGPITRTAPPTGGGFPFSLTPITNHADAWLNVDSASGYAVYDFKNGYGTKAVSKSYLTPKHNATCWSVYSETSKTYYITDGGNGLISEVSVDENTLQASLVTQYQQASGTDDEWIGRVNGQDYLWVLRSDKLVLDTLELGAPGKAKTIQQLGFNDTATKAGISVGPSYVQGLASYIIA